MKNFSLIVLLCFSISLQGFPPAGGAAAAAAAAQKYSNSGQSILNTAENLLNDYWIGGSPTTPEGLPDIVNDMEEVLCGVNASSGGLSIDSNGNYVNCNGGIAGAYNTWAAQVNYWAPIIAKDTSDKNWSGGYDACAVSYPNSSGYGTNFYADMTAQTNNMNTVTNNLQQIIGCTLPAAPTGTQSGACVAGTAAALPNKLTNASTLFNNIMNELNTLLNGLDLNQMYNQVTQVQSSYQAQTAAYTAFVNAYNTDYYASYPANLFAPTATALSNYLTLFNTYTADLENLFSSTLKYLPFQDVLYTTQSFQPAIVKHFLPNEVDPLTGGYPLPSFDWSDSGPVAQIVSYLTNANALATKYNTNLMTIKPRIAAINNQLQTIITNWPTIQATAKTTIADCKEDITNYETNLNQWNGLIGMILGQVLIMVLGSLAGGIGGVAAEAAIMGLASVPPLANETFNKLTSLLSTPLATAIANTNQ